MLKKTVFVLTALLSLALTDCDAQVKEATALLNRINEYYKQQDDYILSLSYVMSRTDNGIQLDKMQGLLKKKGLNTLFKLGDFETGAAEKFNITLDNFNKVVFLSDPVAIKPVNLGDLTDDITNRFFTSAEVIKKSKDETQIIFNIAGGDLSRVEIFFNPATLRLTRVISTYTRKYEEDNNAYPVKITITYDKHTEKAGLRETDFAPARYLITNDGDHRLKPAFAAYKLINKLQKNRNL